MRAVIDTNILIDYLAGVEAARDELARNANASISAITWIVHRATRQPAPCAVLVRRPPGRHPSPGAAEPIERGPRPG